MGSVYVQVDVHIDLGVVFKWSEVLVAVPWPLMV